MYMYVVHTWAGSYHCARTLTPPTVQITWKFNVHSYSRIQPDLLTPDRKREYIPRVRAIASMVCTVAVNIKSRNVTVVRCDYCAERHYVTLPGLQLRSVNELLTQNFRPGALLSSFSQQVVEHYSNNDGTSIHM